MLLMLNDFFIAMDALAVKEREGEHRVITPRLPRLLGDTRGQTAKTQAKL